MRSHDRWLADMRRVHSKPTTLEQMRELARIEIRDLRKRLKAQEALLASLDEDIRAAKKARQ